MLKYILLIVLLAGGLFVANHIYQEKQLQASAKDIQASAQILVIAPAGQPPSYQALEAIQIYGLKGELKEVSSPQDVHALVPAYSVEEIGNGKVAMPLFVLGNGAVLEPGLFYEALSTLPVKDLHPGKEKPYVILYGVEGCPYTAHARHELDEMHVRYEYIDLNSDAARYMGELAARMDASGFHEKSYKTPLLEINGYIRPREGAEEMIESLKQEH